MPARFQPPRQMPAGAAGSAAALRHELAAAVKHHQGGRLDRAEAGYKKVLRLSPQHPQALDYLGLVALDRGQPRKAVKLIEQAIAVAPRFAGARLDLGNALRACGRLAEAADSYRQALALDPSMAAAHSNLALVLNDQSQLSAATESFQRAIALDPRLTEARLGLASVMRRLGRHDEAELSYRAAAEISPAMTEVWIELGGFLAERERLDEAFEAHVRAVQVAPAHAPAHHALGLTQMRRSEMEAAIRSFRTATELAPASADSLNLMGRALRALGRFDEARAAFRRALEIAPAMGDPHRNLATTGNEAMDPRALRRLTQLAADRSRPVGDRITAGFALGKLLDDQGQYDAAFGHYAAANSLALEQIPPAARFDADAFERHVDRLIHTFTRARLAAGPRGRHHSEAPVFVVGLPRSGTSLVEQIAASHSKVRGLGELRDIGRLAAELWEAEQAPNESRVDAARLDALASAHLARLQAQGAGAERVIDKMPDNLFQLGAIAALFPGARVIFCRREGLDTALSCYFQLFTSGNAFSYDLAACAVRYLHSERLADHWLEALPLSTIEVRYEKLVADLEGESRRLIAFLGLDWEPACLSFHETERVVTTASSWQVRQPLYASSVGRWRNYERHIGPLIDVLAHAE